MKMRALVLCMVSSVMVTITFVTYTDLGAFIFNRGSTMFLEARLSLATVLVVGGGAMILSVVALRVEKRIIFSSILIFSFSVWWLSGRVVATAWDGRLATGWFCFRTETIQLLGPSEEYATAWRLERLPGWRVELQRGDGRVERLFVGPALFSGGIELLRGWGVQVTGKPGAPES